MVALIEGAIKAEAKTFSIHYVGHHIPRFVHPITKVLRTLVVHKRITKRTTKCFITLNCICVNLCFVFVTMKNTLRLNIHKWQ